MERFEIERRRRERDEGDRRRGRIKGARGVTKQGELRADNREQIDYVLEVRSRNAARESLHLRQKKAHICLPRQCVLFSTK